ncbi:MAG: hypothetical protein R6U10_02215 [Thermoplasmatota archaeon]
MADTGEGWEEKGTYSGYVIMGKGDKRRLVDENTGDVITEYTV